MANLMEESAQIHAMDRQQHMPYNSTHQTHLMRMALAGNLTECRRVAASEVKKRDSKGCTALMLAAEYGHLEIVNLLLDAEARMQDVDGITALMIATRFGHMPCVKALLPYEISMRDAHNGTALMFAALFNDVAIAKLLFHKEAGVQTVDGVSALMMAAHAGDVEICKLLMSKEAGLRTRNGWTALSFACVKHNYPIVQLLKSKEARSTDRNGMTSLMRAAHTGCVQAVECLLKDECNLKDSRGRTALMYAANAGYTECAKLLAPYEAGQQDKVGRTALMIAGSKNCTAIVELLVASEGGLATKNGETALTYGQIPHYPNVTSIVKRHIMLSSKAVTAKALRNRLLLAFGYLNKTMAETLPFFDAFCSLNFDDIGDTQDTYVETALNTCMLELESLLDIESDDPACSICFDSLPALVYMPCRHLCICELCDKLLKTRKCPICTTPIEYTITINEEEQRTDDEPVPKEASKTKQGPTTVKKHLTNSISRPVEHRNDLHPAIPASSVGTRKIRKVGGASQRIIARTLEELEQEDVPGGHFLKRGLIHTILKDTAQREREHQAAMVKQPKKKAVKFSNESSFTIPRGKTIFEQFNDGELDLNAWPGSPNTPPTRGQDAILPWHRSLNK